MKRLFLILALFLPAFIAFSQVVSDNVPEQEPFYKHEYSFGVFQVFNGALSNGYEYHLSSNKSLRFELEIMYSDNLDQNGFFGNDKRIGGMIQAQYKYYVLGNKERPRRAFQLGGLYLGPFAKYRYLEIERYPYDNYYYDGSQNNFDTEFDRFNIGMAGVLFGIRFIFFQKIVIDGCVGGGLRVADVQNNGVKQSYKESSVDIGYSGIAPAGNFTVGIRF